MLPFLSLTLPQWRLPLLPATKVVAATRPNVQEAGIPSLHRSTNEFLSEPRSMNASNMSRRHERADLDSMAAFAETNGAVDLPTNPPNESTTRQNVQPALDKWNPILWFIAAWLIGLTVVLLPFAFGLGVNMWMMWRSKRLRASKWTGLVDELAARLGLTRRVTLLETRETVVPMTWGIVRPVVLLPNESHDWSDERRRFVLLHELAHVKRLDVLFQSIARLACALYWFNPLAWYALWRLRVERELACDDCVVAAGERPSDYASQLVQIARAYRPARFSVGVAMARSTKLEQRIVAMLDRARSHLPVGKQLARSLLAAACVVVLGLSVVGLGERPVSSAEESQDAAVGYASELAAETKLVHGLVVDESGQPIANADVYTILASQKRLTRLSKPQVVAETKTDRAGRFEIEVPPHDEATLAEAWRIQHPSYLLGMASGFGPDTRSFLDGDIPDDEIKITLVKDTVPLEGRVLDLEGRPIAGVRLRVRSIMTTTADLDAWVAKALNNPTAIPDDIASANEVLQNLVRFPSETAIEVDGLSMFPPVATDGDGRFRIDGLGPNRFISLEVDGPDIAKEWICAVTRSMPTVPLPEGDPRSRGERCFGTKFDYTAEPTQVITGVVRDQDTKKPIVGTVVSVSQFAGSMRGTPHRFVFDTTDEKGRYRLAGLPKLTDGARPIRLEILPNASQPYFRTGVTVSKEAAGLDPISFDIELKRAVWASGRLIDQTSGEPVQGRVSYYPFIDNSAAAKYFNFDSRLETVGHNNWYRTSDDGSYRIPAVSGRGIVAACAFPSADYRIGAGADKIGWQWNSRDKLVYHLASPELTNAVRETTIQGEEAKGQDVELVRLTRQRVQLLDPNREPLRGVRLFGLRPASALTSEKPFYLAPVSNDASIYVLGLEMDGRRLMLFSQDARRLGKVIVADRSTEAVTLEPHATLAGRVVDPQGAPLEGLSVAAVIPASAGLKLKDKPRWGPRRHYVARAKSNSEGRFRFDNILPGAKYQINVNYETVTTTDVVEPGETIEFGDLRATSDDDDDQANVGGEKPATGQVGATKTTEAPSKAATFRIAGRVLGPDDKPLTGAKLYFAPHVGATEQDLQVRDVADSSGKFSFMVPVADLDRVVKGLRAPWSHPRVTARFDGLGPGWKYVVKPHENEDLTLRLVRDDVPIQGRIVTLEGNPVPGATIHVLRVEASPEENLRDWLDALANAGELWAQGTFKLTNTLRQDVSGLPAQVHTDQQGHFKLTGIGRQRVVNLRVEGPTIETREFSAMTRKDGTIRVPFDKDQPANGTLICYATGFSHAAAPSRAVAGTVLDAKSGEPVSGVTIFCYKRAGNPVHGRYQPETVADAEGKFVLTGLPKGADNKIQFLPPTDQPYLPMMQTLDTSDGLEPLVVDIKMNHGALIHGRVTDESTGKPVAGARINYFSLRNENAAVFPGFRNSDDITTTTDADGRYQVFGLPGRGLIAVRALSNQFAAGQAIDAVEDDSRLERGIGDRAFRTEPRICLASRHHSVAVVEAKENVKNVRDVPLLRGQTLNVKVVGPDGQPLTGAEVNRRGMEAGQWSGGEVELEGAEFTALGLSEDQPRTLFVRHRAKGLAAARVVRHDDKDPIVIRLEPAGEIVGRLLDQGQPAAFVEFRGKLIGSATQQNDWLQITTDKAGRFRIEGLVPGMPYRLRKFRRVGEVYSLSSRESQEPVDLIVQSGNTLDLGDVLVE
jgi:beta-lactamase regulating signal transducer with metallopeptidase domain